MSDEAKDLITKILVVKVANRFTVDQILAHPWMHVDDKELTRRGLQATHERLANHHAALKLKASITAVEHMIHHLHLARMNILDAHLEDAHSHAGESALHLLGDSRARHLAEGSHHAEEHHKGGVPS